MGIAYRSILSFQNDEASISDLSAQVAFWLREKGWQAPTSPGTIASQVSESTLSYSETTTPLLARRWTLTEIWQQSALLPPPRESITSVTLIDKDKKLWLWIDIETPETKWISPRTGATITEPIAAGTPRLIHAILDELQPWDGALPVRHRPLVLEPELFSGVLQALKDEDRFGSIFITAPPARVSLNSWLDKLANLMRPSIGMGNTFVVPLEHLQAFNSRVGFKLAISPGSIRTFLPGVDFDDPTDSFRHKRLTFETLSSMTEKRVAYFLRFSQISRLRLVHIPSFMLEAERSLIRALRFGQSEAISTQAQADSDVTSYLEIANLYEQEASRYKHEVDELRFEAERLNSDLSEASEENYRLSNLVSYLRGQLIASGQAEMAFQEPTQELLPESFESLLDRIKNLEYVQHLGDPQETLRLDSISTPPVALQRAWGAVLTLSAYAEHKLHRGFVGGVEDYIRNTSHGGFSAISQVKPESESVLKNPKFRASREIEVPSTVAKSGRVFCQHHVNLAKGGGYPRLYFFDATSTVGKVFLGHIGVHLENTLSN